MLPVRLPPRVWGIPLLLAATLGFSMLKVTPLRFENAPAPEVARGVSREGQRLEKWGRELEELAKREQLDRSMILARQMRQLGQRLQREGGEPGQVAERIATLSQYLQRLQQELRERALMGDSGAMAAPDVLMSGKQEVLLQQYFGDKRLAEASETPFLAGWLLAPTTLGPAPTGFASAGGHAGGEPSGALVCLLLDKCRGSASMLTLSVRVWPGKEGLTPARR